MELPVLEARPLTKTLPGFTPLKKPLQRIRRIALIGNHPPRRCGIATYTSDVHLALKQRFPDVVIDLWAMSDAPQGYAYPSTVTGTIDQDDPQSYLAAAREITASGADMVFIQHEFGIFGGKSGDLILSLIDRMSVPVAVALHTILEQPSFDQRRVKLALVERCETLVVMAEEGRRLLQDVYGAEEDQVVVIPHGVPDRPFASTEPMKRRFGFSDRKVIMTFGLLSPGKGIETMIGAMPDIVKRHPDALYVVLGATHPHCIARNGERYREALVAHADELSMGAHIHFIDAYFETGELLDHLEAADVYATPYLDPAQITSGTLAYAAALGKAIVSTPYIHACELLSQSHGKLIDFGDSAGFANTIADLLDDDAGRLALRKRTYARARMMIWPRLAETSMDRFELIAARTARKPAPIRQPAVPAQLGTVAIARMTDQTGMFQHSRWGLPDRRHGYCVDDNARALMLSCRNPDWSSWTASYAAFVDHAWNPEAGRFRNFMGYGRNWLEESGSDDSSGRTFWALGLASTQAFDPEIRALAKMLFDDVGNQLSGMTSPRAIAFMMLGLLESGCRRGKQLARWGDDLLVLRTAHRRPGWDWFEPVLAYDNARLCEAMICAGEELDRPDLLRAGISTLDWLMQMQTSDDGHFRPVGVDSFGRAYQPPLPFDQQPVDAWASVDACAAAYAATGETRWRDRAFNAWRWFLGKNDLGVALADIETGECFDGLIPTGVNRNRGAESILAFHLATVSARRLTE